MSEINDFLYSKILVFALLGVGIFFTIRLKFIQFRLFKALKLLADKNNKSALNAFIITAGARIGVGNIIGVSLALSLAGSGAIFWMWVSAFFGAASAFAESTLAQIFKQKNDKFYVGGAAFYIKFGLKNTPLACIFAVFFILAELFGFNALLANTVQIRLMDAGISELLARIICLLAAVLVFAKGVKILNKFVPFMIIAYLLLSLFVVIKNFDFEIFLDIFKNAFDIKSADVGIFSQMLATGIKRGLFSNEAGMGTAASAAAAARAKTPSEQGFIQAFCVFCDILICLATSIFILFAKTSASDANHLINSAFFTHFGNLGEWILFVFLLLFAISSFYGNYYYSRSNFIFLLANFKRNFSPIYRWIFNFFAVLFVFLGSIFSMNFVWQMADFLMFFCAIINLIALILLRKFVFNANSKTLPRKK